MLNHIPISPKRADEADRQFIRRAVNWYYGRGIVTFNKASIKVILDTITPEAEMKTFIDNVVKNLEEAHIDYTAVNPIGHGDIVGFRIQTK